jgi:hypothetical protein
MATQGEQRHGPFGGPAAADSERCKIELENDRMRIVRIKYSPGDTYVMHGRPAMIGIFLGNASFRLTYSNGTAEQVTATTGQIMHLEPLDYLGENIGSEPFELLAVELKPSIPVSPYSYSRPA